MAAVVGGGDTGVATELAPGGALAVTGGAAEDAGAAPSNPGPPCP